MLSWMFWGEMCVPNNTWQKGYINFQTVEIFSWYEVVLLERVMSLWIAFETVKHVFCPVYVGVHCASGASRCKIIVQCHCPGQDTFSCINPIKCGGQQLGANFSEAKSG